MSCCGHEGLRQQLTSFNHWPLPVVVGGTDIAAVAALDDIEQLAEIADVSAAQLGCCTRELRTLRMPNLLRLQEILVRH